MRNLKDLVGTEDYLNRLELTFQQIYIQQTVRHFCRHVVDYSFSEYKE